MAHLSPIWNAAKTFLHSSTTSSPFSVVHFAFVRSAIRGPLFINFNRNSHYKVHRCMSYSIRWLLLPMSKCWSVLPEVFAFRRHNNWYGCYEHMAHDRNNPDRLKAIQCTEIASAKCHQFPISNLPCQTNGTMTSIARHWAFIKRASKRFWFRSRIYSN